MNSRERLKCALNHKEPDRVPIDLAATRSGGISTIAYNNLKKYLNIEEETYMFDIQQQLCWPGEEILKKFNVDVIDTGRKLMEKRELWNEFTMNDGSKALLPKVYNYKNEKEFEIKLYTDKGTLVGIKPPSSLYVGQEYYPWMNEDEIPEDIKSEDFGENLWGIPSMPWHYDINKAEDVGKIKTEIESLYNDTEYGLFLDLGFAGLFEVGMYMRGLENWFCDLMLDTAGVERMLDVYVERILDRIDKVIPLVGDKLQVVRLYHDDMGNQNGLAVSPEVLRNIMFPRHKIIIDRLRKYTDAKIMLHSCGAIGQIIPDIIEAGVDIINPLQMNCDNMDIAAIKAEYGKDITLWGGGCDAVDVLTNGSIDEIKDHVKKMLEICMKDGGFVFCNTHNIQADIAPEKIMAIYETVEKYGRY